MYRFAYLYVRLGYFLSGVIAFVALLYSVTMILNLEFDKTRDSSDRFNAFFSKKQMRIISGLNTIEVAFGLDPNNSTLEALRNRNWSTRHIDGKSSNWLQEQLGDAQSEVEDLRNQVVVVLNDNLDEIIRSLSKRRESSQASSVPKPAGVKTDGLQPTINIPLFVSGANFEQKLRLLSKARDSLEYVLDEAKKPENQIKFKNAIAQVERIDDAVADARTDWDYGPTMEETVSPEIPASTMTSRPASSRRQNIAGDLRDAINEVRSAATQEWSLEQIVNELSAPVGEFSELADRNTERNKTLWHGQANYVGIFLIALLVSFFIAVGADIVRALLDSAVWLSHIGSQSSQPQENENE